MLCVGFLPSTWANHVRLQFAERLCLVPRAVQDLRHRQFRVVVQNRLWHAAQTSECFDVPFQERFRCFSRKRHHEAVV